MLERSAAPEPSLRRPVVVLNWADSLRGVAGRPREVVVDKHSLSGLIYHNPLQIARFRSIPLSKARR